MRRRAFMRILGGAAVSRPLAARAQQPPGKVARIGYLASGAGSRSSPNAHLTAAFREGLRELGWVEGRNVAIDYRFGEGRFDRLPDLAAELLRLPADVIVAQGTPATVAASNATGTVPIVMINAGAVQLGLVASIARPGGNVTGLAYSVGPEIFGKGLQMLKEAVPTAGRVAILSNPANPVQPTIMRDLKAAAQSLGVELQLLEARSPDQLDDAFAAMGRERAGALLVVSDPLFGANRARLADLAARNRLPSMHGARENVEAGDLMSYGPSFPDQARRAAVYVDKILKGARPADLPIEQPTKFELVINLKTAKALGIEIPPSLLARADEVIE